MTAPKPTAPALLDDDTVDAEVVDDTTVAGDLVTTSGDLVRYDDDGRILSLIQPDEEWGDVGDGDLAPGARRIPYLKLNRNLDGGFTDPDTGEVSTEIDFVWLAKGRSRAWFPKDFKKTDIEPPACRSADGLKADPSSPALQNGGDCTTCPLASFDEGVRGTDEQNRPRKQCKEAIEALVALPDPHGFVRLARLRWAGLAYRPAADYWDSHFIRMPATPPIAFVAHAKLVPTDSAYGEKLAPEFHRVSSMTRSAAQPLIEERDRRLADFQADVAADVAEGVGHQDSDEGDPFAGGGGGPVGESTGRGGDTTTRYADEEPF